ncbi:MAG TPA: hypothetical protein VM487_06565, partial [Phycisphaerae bacterium]|nr:hypothetical protein [Phycisphaerae bacterium]
MPTDLLDKAAERWQARQAKPVEAAPPVQAGDALGLAAERWRARQAAPPVVASPFTPTPQVAQPAVPQDALGAPPPPEGLGMMASPTDAPQPAPQPQPAVSPFAPTPQVTRPVPPAASPQTPGAPAWDPNAPLTGKTEPIPKSAVELQREQMVQARKDAVARLARRKQFGELQRGIKSGTVTPPRPDETSQYDPGPYEARREQWDKFTGEIGEEDKAATRLEQRQNQVAETGKYTEDEVLSAGPHELKAMLDATKLDPARLKAARGMKPSALRKSGYPTPERLREAAWFRDEQDRAKGKDPLAEAPPRLLKMIQGEMEEQ